MDLPAAFPEKGGSGDADNELELLVDYLNFSGDQLGDFSEPSPPASGSLNTSMNAFSLLGSTPSSVLDSEYLIKFEENVPEVDERAKSSMLVTTEVGMPTEDEYDDDNDTGLELDAAGNPTKRRRRVRNAKQQELNRLAQQRYRQRKKQRYSDLQTTVDALANQLEALTAAEKENVALRNTNSQLREKLMMQTSKVSQLERKVEEQESRLKCQDSLLQRVKQQEEIIAKQQEQLQAQSTQIDQLKSQLSTTDTNVLLDKVSAAIRSALGDVKEHSIADKVMQHICRCCREMGALPAHPATPEGHTAIQVSCC